MYSRLLYVSCVVCIRLLIECWVIRSWEGFVFNNPTTLFLTISLAPINVSASAPGDFQLQVDWDRPDVLYPPYQLGPNTTFLDTWNITDVMLLVTFFKSGMTFFSFLSLNWRVSPVMSSVSFLIAFSRTRKPSKVLNILEVLVIQKNLKKPSQCAIFLMGYIPAFLSNCAQWIHLIIAHSAVVGSWEEPPNSWLMVSKNAIVDWTWNFSFLMILKGAVNTN